MGWLPRTPLLAGYRDGGQSTKYDRTCLISVRSFRHDGRPTSPSKTQAAVLGNLLDNALRHTPAGGSVTISAALSPGTGDAELSVADTGEGIPAEHLPHVFERFYRVDTARDRTHGGSGIGLAIAKALVEAHGGQLTATSPGTGQGSTIRILLPRG